MPGNTASDTGPLRESALTTAAKLETLVALVRQDVQQMARRVEDLIGLQQRESEKWDSRYSALETRVRTLEVNGSLRDQRIDTMQCTLDEVRKFPDVVEKALKAQKEDTQQALARDVNQLRSDQKEADGKADEIDKRLEKVEALTPALRAVMWVGAALGLSIIGLLWSLITGTAQIIFK